MSTRHPILVTGGAGYIGSHCCKLLYEEGYLPICIDNLSTGHRNFVRWGPLVVGDIRDTDTLNQIFRQHRIVAVMHFAASSLVGESVSDPQKYYENNIAGALALLRAMRNAVCNKIIFSSTGAVYGNAGRDPIREDSPCEPVNPYGRSKWMIEQILGDYRHAYNLRGISLRYFNACGADPAGHLGELREQESHLIPRAMMAIRGHLPDFSIYGDDYDTPDGTAIRDYVHVADLAAAHLLALKTLINGSNGGTYNLGTGLGLSVREILAAIAIETGREVPVTIKERRHGDPTHLVADASAAKRALDFHPNHSDISTIIRTAWKWSCAAHPEGSI